MWKPRWKSIRLDLADVAPPAYGAGDSLAIVLTLFMRAVILVKQILGLPAATKSQTGFLVALVGIVTIGGKEAITHIGVLNRNEAIACIALGVAGFLSWLSGRLFEGKRVQPSQDPNAPADEAATENPLAFFMSLKFWGVVLILSAAILSCFAATRRRPVMELRARPPASVVVNITNVVTVTNEAPKATFPPLELQGLVVNGAKSSAVINGQVLAIGERIGDVVLVAVNPEYVTVGLEGQVKWLVLRR